MGQFVYESPTKQDFLRWEKEDRKRERTAAVFECYDDAFSYASILKSMRRQDREERDRPRVEAIRACYGPG